MMKSTILSVAIAVFLASQTAAAFHQHHHQKTTRSVLPSSSYSSSSSSNQKFGRKNGFILGPTASNGLIWDDLTPGQGRRVLPGDSVVCYYSGSFETSTGGGPFGVGSKTSTTVFDQTKEGEPFKFVVGKGQVIKGWDLGILGGLDGEILPMSVGGVRRLYIPSGLAYGTNSVGPIPANQDLIFDLEILYAQKESDISTEKRLGGYAAALAIPAVLLFIAFNVFPLLF